MKSPANTGFEFTMISADKLMTFLEEILGMKPPSLPSDHCQVLTQIYMGPDYNQWEEDFDRDAQAVERLKKRIELNNMTPAERLAHFDAARKKFNEERQIQIKKGTKELVKLLRKTPRKKRKKRAK
jgi:hypothetical protein